MTMFSMTALSQWMLHWRARRLPPPLTGRLLEEWLAEAEALDRRHRLAFVAGVFLTRTSTLVQADAGEHGPQEAVISIDDVLVPATELPTLCAAFLLDLLWIAPLALIVLRVLALPPPDYLLEVWIAAIIVAAVEGVQVALFGGSFGLRAMKLRIVSTDGEPVRIRHLVVRAACILAFPIVFSLFGVLLGVHWALWCGLSGALRVWMGNPRSGGRDSLSGTMIVYAVPRVVAARDQ